METARKKKERRREIRATHARPRFIGVRICADVQSARARACTRFGLLSGSDFSSCLLCGKSTDKVNARWPDVSSDAE